MERFANFEQYQMAERRVRDRAKAAGVKALSNDYLLPDAARRLIAEERLAYEELGGNLYLLTDCGTYYTLAFSVVDEGAVTPVFVPRSTKVVWTYRAKGDAASDEKDDSRARAADVIGRMGFGRARTLARMRRMVGDGPVGDGAAGDLRVEPAGERNREAIESLLRGNFDPVLGELPDRQGLESDIDAGRVLVAQADGAVVGIVRVGIEGRCAWIRQIAVRESARGHHVGRALVDGQIRRFGGDVREFDLWVDVRNEAAIRLYEATGYVAAGQRADEYLPR